MMGGRSRRRNAAEILLVVAVFAVALLVFATAKAKIDSDEGIWNSGKNGSGPNLGYRPRHKEGYFPVPPSDKLQDLRSEIVLALIEAGIDVEVHHHEVGTAGQTEIDMRFKTLVKMADQVMLYKYVIRNVCARNGYVAFATAPRKAVTIFTQADLEAGQVAFVHNGRTADPASFDIVVADKGGTSGAPQTVRVTVKG